MFVRVSSRLDDVRWTFCVWYIGFRFFGGKVNVFLVTTKPHEHSRNWRLGKWHRNDTTTTCTSNDIYSNLMWMSLCVHRFPALPPLHPTQQHTKRAFHTKSHADVMYHHFGLRLWHGNHDGWERDLGDSPACPPARPLARPRSSLGAWQALAQNKTPPSRSTGAEPRQRDIHRE